MVTMHAMASHTTSSWVPGTDIGGFVLLEEIGAGGFGEVWKAQQTRPERTVAVKRFHISQEAQSDLARMPKAQRVSQEESLRARFVQESNALARLDHPNVVKVFTAGEFDGSAYFSMEYLDGVQNLKDLIDECPHGLDLHVIEGLMAQLCAGVGALHAVLVDGLPMVHRDLKPQNALVVRRGVDLVVKVVDLGSVRFGSRGLTTVGVPTTDLYAAPEMKVHPPESSPASDVFALVVMIVELVSPLPVTVGGKSWWAVVVERPLEIARILEQEVPTMPEAVRAVVARGLEKNPAMRYQGAGELGEALRSAWPHAAAAGSSSPPPDPVEHDLLNIGQPAGGSGENAIGEFWSHTYTIRTWPYRLSRVEFALVIAFLVCFIGTLVGMLNNKKVVADFEDWRVSDHACFDAFIAVTRVNPDSGLRRFVTGDIRGWNKVDIRRYHVGYECFRRLGPHNAGGGLTPADLNSVLLFVGEAEQRRLHGTLDQWYSPEYRSMLAGASDDAGLSPLINRHTEAFSWDSAISMLMVIRAMDWHLRSNP